MDEKPEDKPVPENPTPVEQLDPRTRAQVAEELHLKKQKERQEKAEQIKADYVANKDNPAVLDILEKARSFAAYHTKLAKDAVGVKNMGFDESGAPMVEDVVFTSEQRLAELDQAKGLEQLISYIEQKLA